MEEVGPSVPSVSVQKTAKAVPMPTERRRLSNAACSYWICFSGRTALLLRESGMNADVNVSSFCHIAARCGISAWFELSRFSE
jgi:hypothetical protein